MKNNRVSSVEYCCHKLISRCNKYNAAFTLAEVLITLGVIGIVASMTLPAIIQNVQDLTYKSRWKKAYSDFARAALQMSNDYEVETFKEIVELEAPNYEETPNRVTNTVTNIINKYFKLITYSANDSTAWKCWNERSGGIIGNEGSSIAGINYKYLNGVDAGYWVFGYHPTACFVTADYVFGVDTNTSVYGRFSIDVNGSKRPNVIGRDVFVVNINNLRKPIAGGGNGFFDSEDYECRKDAAKGGPACSLEYLLK